MEKPNILVVDDAMDMRIYLKALVQGMGLGAVVARDGTEGLAAAGKLSVALVLLDIMMPGEGGILMYRTLRQSESLKGIPVIIHSAIPERLFHHYILGTVGSPGDGCGGGVLAASRGWFGAVLVLILVPLLLFGVLELGLWGPLRSLGGEIKRFSGEKASPGARGSIDSHEPSDCSQSRPCNHKQP